MQHFKKIPRFETDEEAERFVEESDLSEYDLSEFQPMKLESLDEDITISMKLPAPLVKQMQAKAEAQGIPYSRYIRRLLEADLSAR